MRRSLIPLAALVLAVGVSPAFAAAPAPPQAQAQARATSQKSQMIQGELVSVDPMKKTLTVKTSTGEQEQFAYTAETVITGATSDPAGLATASGSNVTVEYTEEGTSRTATKITVEKAK